MKKKINTLQLLEEIRKMNFCCINLTSDYHYRWSIDLTPGFGYREHESHKPVISLEGENFEKLIQKTHKEAKKYIAKYKFS